MQDFPANSAKARARSEGQQPEGPPERIERVTSAEATATATGGAAERGGEYLGVPGSTDATAHAEASAGDATATAREIGGAGAPGFEGASVSGPYMPGGEGGSAVMTDAP